MKFLEISLIGFVLFFSFIINFYYGHQGLMPLDDLQNFNSGYRILTGDFPFRDYYSITGPFLDIMQGYIYKIFGISWQSFVLHASIMNCLYSISVFLFLKNLEFKTQDCFFYSLSAGLLMYAPSGNPTVEHNSLILSLIATFFFIISLKENKKVYLFASIFIFFISFFTKQVPTAYFAIFCIIIFFSKIFSEIKISTIISTIIFSLIISFLFFLFFKHNKVQIADIFEQYIIISTNLGESRFNNLDFNFIYEKISKLFFLLCLIIPSLYISVISKKNHSFIIITSLSVTISIYEIHSNNQPITFSLLPIFISLFYFFYIKENLNLKFVRYFLIFIIIYAFYRVLRFEFFYLYIFIIMFIYLYRFKKVNIKNLTILYLFISSLFYFEKYIKIRAWDELKKNDLQTSFNAGSINSKLNYLKWKTVYFKKTASEKKMIFSTLNYLESLKNETNYILISDYQIYNAILGKKDFSPVKYWFENAAYPSKNHELRFKFDEFFKSKIIDNNISQIIFDNTAQFKSMDLKEFSWLYECSSKKTEFLQEKYLDVFEIKKDCIK